MDTQKRSRDNQKLPDININVITCQRCIMLEDEIDFLKSEVFTLKEDNRILKEDNRILKEDNRILKEDNRILKEDNRILKEDNRILKKRLDDIDDSAKLRQFATDLMDVYIDKFQIFFNLPDFDSSQIYMKRDSVDQNELYKFDNLFFGKEKQFYIFSKTLKTFKGFNVFAHPKYTEDDVRKMVREYVMKGSPITDVVSKYIKDLVNCISNDA